MLRVRVRVRVRVRIMVRVRVRVSMSMGLNISFQIKDEHRSMIEEFKLIWHKGGIKGLYRGFTLNFMKVFNAYSCFTALHSLLLLFTM